jgi:cytochrome c peroxidase
MSRRLLPLALLLALGAAPGAVPEGVPKDTLPADLALDVVPQGLGPRQVPRDNPLTEAHVRLGRQLFFDPLLSADGTVACASCHRPEYGFSGGAARSRGLGGRLTSRKAPTLFNRAFLLQSFLGGFLLQSFLGGLARVDGATHQRQRGCGFLLGVVHALSFLLMRVLRKK